MRRAGRRRRVGRADRAHGNAARRADGRSNPLVEARGVAGNLAGRPLRRLHRARNQLERQRLRDGDLGGRRGDRRQPAVDQREEVEPVPGMVAGRRENRLHVGPQRQAAALPDQPARRRRRGADQRRRRRRQLRLVTRRQDDRLHRDGGQTGGDQGSRQEVRRVPGGRAGSPHDASVRHRPGDARDPHADQRRLHRRQLHLVARRPQHRLRSPRQPDARERGLGGHLDRHRRRRDGAKIGDAGRSRLQSGVVAGRFAHRVPDGDGQPGLLLHQQRHRHRPSLRRHPDRGVLVV